MEKKYKVYYSQDLKKPMIRLSNNFLKECGFWVGDSILVTYEKNKILIVKEEADAVFQKTDDLKINNGEKTNANRI